MHYDAIIVLAGGIQDDGTLPTSVKDRIQVAKKLFLQKKAPLLVMSGKWSTYRQQHRPPLTEAEAMKRYATQIGIPPTSILKETRSHTTVDNIRLVHQDFIMPRRWKKVIVVTSDFHVARVKMYCQKFWLPNCQVTLEVSLTNASFLKRFRWWIREKIVLLSDAHRFA